MVNKLLFFALILCSSFTNGKIRYNTLEAMKMSRSTVHVPKIVNKMCLLLTDEGPCRAEISMWHFSPEIMECKEFSWGGCQGNGNRFDTENECLTTCLSQPGQTIKRPEYCNLSFDYGYCFGDDKRWYYDRKWQVCKETIYSGCGGNKNNFYSLAGCESMCRFGRGRPLEAEIDDTNAQKVLIINPDDSTTSRSRAQPKPKL